jgi:hypothetical protein
MWIETVCFCCKWMWNVTLSNKTEYIRCDCQLNNWKYKTINESQLIILLNTVLTSFRAAFRWFYSLSLFALVPNRQWHWFWSQIIGKRFCSQIFGTVLFFHVIFIVIADMLLVVAQFGNQFFGVLALPMTVVCVCRWARSCSTQLFLLLLNRIHQPRILHFFQLLCAVYDKIGALNNLINDGLNIFESFALSRPIHVWCSLLIFGEFGAL